MGIEADWSAIHAAARAEKIGLGNRHPTAPTGRSTRRSGNRLAGRNSGSERRSEDGRRRRRSFESSTRPPSKRHDSDNAPRATIVERYTYAGRRNDDCGKTDGAPPQASMLIYHAGEEPDDHSYLDNTSGPADLLDAERLFDEELQALQRRYVKRDLYRRYLGVNQGESELPTFVEIPPDILNDFSTTHATLTAQEEPQAQERVGQSVDRDRSRHSPCEGERSGSNADHGLGDKRRRGSGSSATSSFLPDRDRQAPTRVKGKSDEDVPQKLTRRDKSRENPHIGSTETTPPEIVFRDRSGRRIGEHEWMEQQRNLKPGRGGFAPIGAGPDARTNKVSRNKAKVEPVEWGSGLKQARDEQRRREEEAIIIQQPFTRYTIDSTHDKQLQEATRWEDPLRFFSPSSPHSSSEDAGSPNLAAAKETPVDVNEFIERTEANKRKRRVCQFTAPPNRYGIGAGYRWDGVVRGNGFEARLLSSRAPREVHNQLADDF